MNSFFLTVRKNAFCVFAHYTAFFDGEKSDYFPRLVLKGRALPVPSGGILAGGYGAAWESKF